MSESSPIPWPRRARQILLRVIGRIPTPESSGVVTEWFLAGTEPTEPASVWLKPGPGGTRLVLPPEYQTWCASPHNHLGAEAEVVKQLIIRTPTDGGRYVIDPSLAPEQQMLLLKAIAPADAMVNWTVDGKPVEATGTSFFWRLEPGKHIATALHREALEETGLGVEITAHAGSTTFEMAHAQIVVLCLEARVLSGRLRLSDEHDDFVWAPLPELASWPSTPAVDAFMLDYARRKQSS